MNNYAFWQPCRKNIPFSCLPRIPEHLVCQNPHPLGTEDFSSWVCQASSSCPRTFSCQPLSILAAGCRGPRGYASCFSDETVKTLLWLSSQDGWSFRLVFQHQGRKPFQNDKRSSHNPHADMLISRTPVVRLPPLQITLYCWVGGGEASNYTFLAVCWFCDCFKEEWNNVDIFSQMRPLPQSLLSTPRSMKVLIVWWCFLLVINCYVAKYPNGLNKNDLIILWCSWFMGEIRWVSAGQFCSMWYWAGAWFSLEGPRRSSLTCLRSGGHNWIPVFPCSLRASPIASPAEIRPLTLQFRASKVLAPRESWRCHPFRPGNCYSRLILLIVSQSGKDMDPPLNGRNVKECVAIFNSFLSLFELPLLGYHRLGAL